MSEASIDDKPRWLVLLPTSDSQDLHRRPLRKHMSYEDPPNPPNTARESERSSARHSPRQSPIEAAHEDEDSEETPIELSIHATPASSVERLSILRRRTLQSSPSINRELSGLSSQDLRFRTHRDSVEITAGYLRRCEIEGKVNKNLMNNHHDSFVLTKSRLEARHPRTPMADNSIGEACGWLQCIGPLHQTSSPSEDDETKLAMPHVLQPAETKPERNELKDTHPEEETDCPICELHRPRWFEANHREERLGS